MFRAKEGNTNSRDAQSAALGSDEARSEVVLRDHDVKVLMAC